MSNYLRAKIESISGGRGESDTVEQLRKISKNTRRPLEQLFLALGSHCLDTEGKFKFLLYLDLFHVSEKYDLLIESCASLSSSSNKVFYAMEDALGDGEFFDYVSEKISDKNPICQIMRSENNYLFSRLEICVNLRRLLFDNAERIPQTLESILQTAIEKDSYNIVVQLGAYLPKKRILGILIEYGDPILIDKFFSLYKEYPEIKNLTAFI